MPRPRKYPPALLERGARLVFESDRPIAHVARDLGVPSETLRKYVRQVEADEGRRPDLPTSEVSRPGFDGVLEAGMMSWRKEILRGYGPTEEVPRRACGARCSPGA
jgi:hypothetical protein